MSSFSFKTYYTVHVFRFGQIVTVAFHRLLWKYFGPLYQVLLMYCSLNFFEGFFPPLLSIFKFHSIKKKQSKKPPFTGRFSMKRMLLFTRCTSRNI